MTPREFAAAKYRWLDRLEADHQLGHLTFRLAYILTGYFNRQTADAWPSQTTLAGRLGVTVRAVQKCLDQLGNGGYIAAEMGTGRGNTNRYRPTINGEPLFVLSEGEGRTAVPERANDRSEKGEPSFVQTSLYDHSLSKPSKATYSEGMFEEWFQYYPRKVSQIAARQAYEETITKGKATHQQLIAGAKRFAIEQEGRDPYYISSPVRWLQQGRWSDEPARQVMDGRI